MLPDQVTSWDICYPSRDALQNQINQVLESHYDIRHVYIATDDVIAYEELQLKFNNKVSLWGSDTTTEIVKILNPTIWFPTG